MGIKCGRCSFLPVTVQSSLHSDSSILHPPHFGGGFDSVLFHHGMTLFIFLFLFLSTTFCISHTDQFCTINEKNPENENYVS